MKSVGAVILAIFAILLFASTTMESRNVPGGEYWREVMKNQAMPKAIKSLISHKTKLSHAFTDEFEPIPNVSTYPNDRTTFTVDFEPVPNLSAYPNDKKSTGDANDHGSDFTDEFEPIPNLSTYPNDQTYFTDEFEPVPNLSAYPDELKSTGHVAKTYESFAQEFEPSPNLSVYNE